MGVLSNKFIFWVQVKKLTGVISLTQSVTTNTNCLTTKEKCLTLIHGEFWGWNKPGRPLLTVLRSIETNKLWCLVGKPVTTPDMTYDNIPHLNALTSQCKTAVSFTYIVHDVTQTFKREQISTLRNRGCTKADRLYLLFPKLFIRFEISWKKKTKRTIDIIVVLERAKAKKQND